MNTTQRPNFVLVCIAVVLLSFSFAGEMLCSSLQRTVAPERGPLVDAGSTEPQQTKPSDYQVAIPEKAPSADNFASNTPATDADRHAATSAISAALTAEMGDDDLLIDSIPQSNVDAVEASSKSESVRHNHQVAEDLNFVADNSVGNNAKATHSADSKSRRSIAKMASIKPKVVAIAVSAKRSGYNALLPSYFFDKQAQSKLKRAIERVNLGDSAKDKLKLSLLEGGHPSLIELEQEDTAHSATDKLVDFLKGLTGYTAEEKIYVLKNLSEEKIEALRQILNAHNITLRAFIKA